MYGQADNQNRRQRTKDDRSKSKNPTRDPKDRPRQLQEDIKSTHEEHPGLARWPSQREMHDQHDIPNRRGRSTNDEVGPEKRTSFENYKPAASNQKISRVFKEHHSSSHIHNNNFQKFSLVTASRDTNVHLHSASSIALPVIHYPSDQADSGTHYKKNLLSTIAARHVWPSWQPK